MTKTPLRYPLSKSKNIYLKRLINMINPIFRHMIYHSRKKKNVYIPDSLEFTRRCIDKAVRWILIQQGLQKDGGVSAWVAFSKGRLKIGASYPEVTGYIIPTLFDYASIFNNKKVFDAAIKASDFELSLQDPNGYFPGNIIGRTTGPSVFNSAQIIHGLVRTYKETKRRKYIKSALKACRWICKVQGEDGAWGKFNYLGMKRVYDTKVCQALLEVDKAISSNELLDCVNRNLDFVILNQKENGWFYNCDNSFDKNNAPLTHTIGYTTQGLLECYKIINREDLLTSAKKTLNVLLHKFEIEKNLLAGRFFSDWKPAITSSCLTGDAQISLCWLDLYKITGDFRYLNASLKMNDLLKMLQFNCRYKEIDGILPSSYPIEGDYGPFAINSWTVKYYIDALIKEYRLKKRLQEMIK